MSIEKKPLQRLVTIALDGNGQVTHAFQQTTFAVLEDGVEIGRSNSPQLNIEPKDLGDAVPQADLLSQLAAQQAAAAAAAGDAAAALKRAEDDAATAQAELQGRFDALNLAGSAVAAEAATLRAALDEALARLATVQGACDAAQARLAAAAAALTA